MAVFTAMRQRGPRPATWGDLDDAPPPYGPDRTVFGGWYPHLRAARLLHASCRACGWRPGRHGAVLAVRADGSAVSGISD